MSVAAQVRTAIAAAAQATGDCQQVPTLFWRHGKLQQRAVSGGNPVGWRLDT